MQGFEAKEFEFTGTCTTCQCEFTVTVTAPVETCNECFKQALHAFWNTMGVPNLRHLFPAMQ